MVVVVIVVIVVTSSASFFSSSPFASSSSPPSSVFCFLASGTASECHVTNSLGDLLEIYRSCIKDMISLESCRGLYTLLTRSFFSSTIENGVVFFKVERSLNDRFPVDSLLCKNFL